MNGIPEEIEVIFEIGLYAGVILFIYGLIEIIVTIQSKKLLDKIRNIPKSKIRSISLGLSEIYGKAITKKEIIAPISKQKCVYYYIEIYTIHKGRWMLCTTEYCNNDFYLDDETGKILVNPKRAKIHLKVNKIIEGNMDRKVFGDENSLYKGELLKEKCTEKNFKEYEHVESFLKEINETNKNLIDIGMLLAPKEMKFKEFIIKENDKIYVLGTVEKNEELVIKMGLEKTLYINSESEKENDEKTIKNDKKLYRAIVFFVIGIVILLYLYNLYIQFN